MLLAAVLCIQASFCFHADVANIVSAVDDQHNQLQHGVHARMHTTTIRFRFDGRSAVYQRSNLSRNRIVAVTTAYTRLA